MLPRGAKIHLSIIVLGALALSGFFQGGFAPLIRGENYLRDTLARTGRKVAPNPHLVYLAIDNDSVNIDAKTDLAQMFDLTNAGPENRRALQLISQGWPWSRAVHALILQRLVEAGAKAVIFDLTFPTEKPSDPDFQAALNRFQNRVVIGANFVLSTTTGGGNAPTFSQPTQTLVPETEPLDDRIGFVNFWPDADEVVRQAQYRVTFEEVNGSFTPDMNSERYLSLVARGAMKAGFGDRIPADTSSRRFRFSGGAQTYCPHSVFEIFVPEYWKRNYQDGVFFKDKIVIVGASGNWQHDEHRTSFGMMAGPELQLHALNALLHRDYITALPAVGNLGLLAFAGLLAAALWYFIRQPWLRLSGTLGISVLWLGAALYFFDRGAEIVAFTPLLIINFSGVAGLATDILLERREGVRIRNTLERYVSHNVVAELLDHSQDYNRMLRGVIKPVTILFSDIRNFTSFSARTDPHELVSQLNEYFSAMVDCVFAYDGTLDKFIGDAVMAVWGNARSRLPEEEAADAVRAALAMRDRLRELNVKWLREGRTCLEIGISLDHGEVVVGNIGSPQRMEFTVIGPAVNMSWRLQELTKKEAVDLLISRRVADLLNGRFSMHYVTTFTPDPASPAIDAYTITGSDSHEMQRKNGA